MSNIGLWSQKSMLDFVLKGATPSPPPGVWIGLSLSPPTSIAFNEVGTGSGYARQTGVFGAALTPASSGSASNASAATFGAFSSSNVINGLFLADGSVLGSGNNLWFGNLATPRTPLPGDSLILAVGALAVTLG